VVSIGGHEVIGVVSTEPFDSANGLPFAFQGDAKFAVEDGIFSMSKETRTDYSPGIRTNFILELGNAWVVRFKLAQQAIYGFHFEWGSFPTNYVGFNGDGHLVPGISEWSVAGTIPESGRLYWLEEGLLPEKWYTYTVALHADGEIYVAITPENDPANPAFELHDNFGAEWAEHDFTLLILGHQGVMYVDQLQEVELAP
jgi:hypothetical protein